MPAVMYNVMHFATASILFGAFRRKRNTETEAAVHFVLNLHATINDVLNGSIYRRLTALDISSTAF
jgi:hypothetical protein